MIRFLVRRFLTMAVTLLIISALVFFIIKLPPGDFLTNQIAELKAQGEAASAAKAEFLIKQYGLDKPVWEQYLIWLGVWPNPDGVFRGLLQGDWGWSFEYDKPVNDVVGVDPDRHLFGDAPILDRRLSGDLHRLYRAGDAELHSRAGAAVLFQPLVRHLDWRAV
jgi:hypothetical protein